MTTIAYRSGILAADTRCTTTSGYIEAAPIQKILRVRGADGGGIMAFTGHPNEAMAFRRWYERGAGWANPEEKMPSLPHTRVIILRRDLSGAAPALTLYEDDSWADLDASYFHAWGSGAIAALAAMYCKADAAEAVKIAMKLDPCTGGEVQTMALFE